MDQQEVDRTLRYVRSLVTEARAAARLGIAQGNRLMHEHPNLPPIDLGKLYGSIDICNKIDAALGRMNLGIALQLFAELKECLQVQETENDVD